MANKKIGQTTNRTTTEATDLIPIERDGALNHISKGDFDAEIQTIVDTSVNLALYKVPVRAASIATVSLVSAPSTLDGVTLVAGNRLLLKNQSAGAENGIYIFTAAASPLARAGDSDISAEVKANMIVSVEEGTVNKNTFWTLTTNNPIVLGTTALVFEPFALASNPELVFFKTTISAAAFRTIGTSPISLVAAPGVNKVNCIIEGTTLVKKESGTPAYDFSAYIVIGTGGAIGPSIDNGLFNVTPLKVLKTYAETYANAEGTNQAIAVTTVDGLDATTGTGSVTISFLYYISDIS